MNATNATASFATQHPDFSVLAARISVSNLHKMTDKSFSDVAEKFFRCAANVLLFLLYELLK